MTLSKQNNFIFNSLLEDIRGSKCCVFKVRQYICEKLVGNRGGGGMKSHSPKCDVWACPDISIWIFGVFS